jgi:Fur family transcriptional regulator, ferric uptake regulator
MDHLQRCKKLLAQEGYSITKPRLAVFEVLSAAQDPLTITQLAQSVTNADKVSVYRTIELFEKVGIVQRVYTGFKSRVELSEAFSPHHHHFTCSRCNATLGLHSEQLENDLSALEREHGFTLTHHSIELTGFCSACSIV